MFNTTINGNLTSNHSEPCIHYDPYNPECDSIYGREPFQLTPAKALSAFGIAILIVIALLGNVLVCAAFCYYRRLRTVTNYFIVSLAISDLLVAGISMPLWLSWEVTGWEKLPKWIDFYTLKDVWEIFDILAGVASVTNLTAVSLDRFFSIIAPLRHRTRMTPIMGMIMISFCWLYSLVVALFQLTKWHDYTLLASVFGFFLPLAIIMFCYTSIYIKFRMRSSHQGFLEGDWNLVKTLLIVIGLFVLCWIPFHMYSLLYTYCLSCEFHPDTMRHFPSFMKWMHYLNSCCNPIVYGFFNINFKTAFWAMFHRCLGRRYSDIDLVGFSRENSSSQNGTFLRHLKSLRRKLSWKRDVEESIVSNGEMNDNSISVAMLALHLKTSANEAQYQEGDSLLLGSSTSRPSSKDSDEQGLLSDEQSTLCESPGKTITKTFEPCVSNRFPVLICNSPTQASDECSDDSDLVFEEPEHKLETIETNEINECEAYASDQEGIVVCSGKRPRRKTGNAQTLPLSEDLEAATETVSSLDLGSCNQREEFTNNEDLSEDVPQSGNAIAIPYCFSSKLYMISDSQGRKDSGHISKCIEGEKLLDSKESVV